MNTKTIPFDLETAKKIQAGEIKGRIMCNNAEANIIDLDMFFQGEKRICAQTLCEDGKYHTNIYNTIGIDIDFNIGYGLYIELQYPDNEPQFKPFDKVLVKMNNDDECSVLFTAWTPAIFQCYVDGNDYYPYLASGILWGDCIPYEGNEHLLGTTDKPKED